METSTRRRVASNTAVQVAGKGVLALGAGSLAVLTRYLGPDGYGRFTLALMYMQLFGVLADVGLFTTVVRDISKDPSRTEQLVGNALTLRLLLSIAMIALGTAVSLLLPYEPDVRLAILLAGGPLLFGMLTSSLVTVLQSRLQMGRAVVGEVSGRAVALGLTVLVARWISGSMRSWAPPRAARRRRWRSRVVTHNLATFRFRTEPAVWRRLLQASLPLGLALAINEIYFESTPSSSRSTSRTTKSVCIRSRTASWSSRLRSAPSTSPRSSRCSRRRSCVTSGPRPDSGSTELLVILGAPLIAAGLVLAPDVIELAGGEGFEDAATPLRILLAASALAAVNGVFGFALIARSAKRARCG